MRLQYAPEDEAFRAELVAWLEANPPRRQMAEEPKQSSADLPDWARDWQRQLFDAGWLVPGWPPELGGRNANADAADDLLRGDVAARDPAQRRTRRVSASSPRRSTTTAPPSSRRRFLLPTLRAEIAWCLGMSEPDAGSDLASLRTRADARRRRLRRRTARRCGRPARITPTGASASCAPIPTRRSTRASARSSST